MRIIIRDIDHLLDLETHLGSSLATKTMVSGAIRTGFQHSRLGLPFTVRLLPVLAFGSACDRGEFKLDSGDISRSSTDRSWVLYFQSQA